MSLFVPTSGSVLDADVTIVGSEKALVWAQIVAADDSSASAHLFDDSAETDGRQIARLATGPCTMGPVFGPFLSTCSVTLGDLAGGCVIVGTRPVSRT